MLVEETLKNRQDDEGWTHPHQYWDSMSVSLKTKSGVITKDGIVWTYLTPMNYILGSGYGEWSLFTIFCLHFRKDETMPFVLLWNITHDASLWNFWSSAGFFPTMLENSCLFINSGLGAQEAPRVKAVCHRRASVLPAQFTLTCLGMCSGTFQRLQGEGCHIGFNGFCPTSY